jgi:hypothetical protein
LITKAELHRAAQAQGLRFDQAEKDYVILWILSAISSNEIASTQWAFKGGTCLRHCFYRGFRFSEDIDFSCQASEANVLNAQSVLKQAALEVQEASGILIDIKDVRSSDNQAQAEILLEYSLRGSRRRGLPLVQSHLTFDEPLYTPTEISSPREVNVFQRKNSRISSRKSAMFAPFLQTHPCLSLARFRNGIAGRGMHSLRQP